MHDKKLDSSSTLNLSQSLPKLQVQTLTLSSCFHNPNHGSNPAILYILNGRREIWQIDAHSNYMITVY